MVENSNPNDGVVGSIASPTSSAPVAMPNKTQIVPVVTTAVQVAVDAVTGQTTSSADTQTAITALAQGMTALAEQAASAAGGPIAGIAADAIAPALGTAIATGLISVMQRLGMEASMEFQKLQALIAKI